MRIKILRLGKAQQTGPNRAKIIRKRDFISRAVLLDNSHDILLRKQELERQIRLVLGN